MISISQGGVGACTLLSLEANIEGGGLVISEGGGGLKPLWTLWDP